MTLQQEKFPFTRCRFELTETALMVAASHLLRSNSVEIPLRELKPIPSYFKQFALSSLMFAISLTAFALAILGGVFDVTLIEERMGLVALMVIVGFFAVCFWLRFFARNVDFVIFHANKDGRPMIYIHRTIPSSRHVQEFVDILREKIENTNLT